MCHAWIAEWTQIKVSVYSLMSCSNAVHSLRFWPLRLLLDDALLPNKNTTLKWLTVTKYISGLDRQIKLYESLRHMIEHNDCYLNITSSISSHSVNVNFHHWLLHWVRCMKKEVKSRIKQSVTLVVDCYKIVIVIVNVLPQNM